MTIINQTYKPNFKAKLVATATTPKSQFQILEVDKVADAQALEKIKDSFTRENILERFPDNGLLSVSHEFIKNAFKSIYKPNTKAYMTLIDGKPSGLMTFELSKPSKYIFLDYLAVWKPDGMDKPYNNGRALMRYLFETALKNETQVVDLTPGFKADEFYEKLGFKKDGFDMNIDNHSIAESIANIDKTCKFTVLKDQPTIDLVV